jgi:RNA polymerase-interacting CarD/CdnL/TRCF family regulator
MQNSNFAATEKHSSTQTAKTVQEPELTKSELNQVSYCKKGKSEMNTINETKMPYSIGDKIVHAFYGVGQVVDIEDKKLNDKTTTYYVVETRNSTFWLPVEKADNERIRPIASSETIENNVIETLNSDPQEMASHYRTRKKRMKDVRASGEIVPIARLVRDLTYRRFTKGNLTDIESRNLDHLKSRLVSEWARSVGTTRRQVRAKIRKILQQHREEIA